MSEQNQRDGLEQTAHVHRLVDERLVFPERRLLEEEAIAVAREIEHFEIRIDQTELPGQFVPRHPGHDHIRQQKIKWTLVVPDPEFANMADLQQRLSKAVDRVNADLSVIEKVRRFIVADAPFTVENEQMTPSLKIRRHVIKQAYGERLDALYRK